MGIVQEQAPISRIEYASCVKESGIHQQLKEKAFDPLTQQLLGLNGNERLRVEVPGMVFSFQPELSGILRYKTLDEEGVTNEVTVTPTFVEIKTKDANGKVTRMWNEQGAIDGVRSHLESLEGKLILTGTVVFESEGIESQ